LAFFFEVLKAVPLGGTAPFAAKSMKAAKVPGGAHNVGLTVRTYAERIRILLF
jgi:hypothetical protein